MSKRVDQILLEPIVTEKALRLQETLNQVVFRVATGATKVDIRNAVAAKFKVGVEAVNVIRVRGKPKRVGFRSGRRSQWKKAYVTLAEGSKIDFFQGV